MSQIGSVEMMMAQAKTSAAAAIAPKQPASVHTMTDAMLADEHRGQGFARDRAKSQLETIDARLKAIEAELERRGLSSARGVFSLCTKQPAKLGLLDLKRLRAELPVEVLAPFVVSDHVWRSRTLSEAERQAVSGD